MNRRETSAGGVLIALFGLLAVLFTGQFPPFSNPNELSRLESVYAFVEQGTFAIDRVIPILGDHEDKASSGAHLYSNKAPGLSLAAIPVYRLLRIFLPRPHSASDAIFVLLRILIISSVCVIALARFHVRLARSPSAPLVVFAVAFGTPYLFYARTFFSHAWTASLLFLAWDLARRAEEKDDPHEIVLSCLASGFLAMWAAITEYPVALIGSLLAVRVFAGRSGKRFWLFATGALPPLLLLAFYNAVCFGSPWVVSSAREASPLYSGLGLEEYFGFGLPNAGVAFRYLVDPARGLLLYSPFLLFVAPGFWMWCRSGRNRPDAIFALASVVCFFVLMTGYRNWHGGWALGNRYLLPALFFAGIALPHALESAWARVIFLTAAVYSTFVQLVLTATWPQVPADLAWPLGTGAVWFLSRGWVAPNLLSFFGALSLFVPVAAAIAGVIVAARSLRPGTPRLLSGALVGILLAVAALLYRPEPPYNTRLWRAAVFGAYSGLDPERDELRQVVVSARTPTERKQAAGAWRLYGK